MHTYLPAVYSDSGSTIGTFVNYMSMDSNITNHSALMEMTIMMTEVMRVGITVRMVVMAVVRLL